MTELPFNERFIKLPYLSAALFWPQILEWGEINMNYLSKMLFFDETPEDNFKAETISVN
jgi:hypothetical protein